PPPPSTYSTTRRKSRRLHQPAARPPWSKLPFKLKTIASPQHFIDEMDGTLSSSSQLAQRKILFHLSVLWMQQASEDEWQWLGSRLDEMFAHASVIEDLKTDRVDGYSISARALRGLAHAHLKEWEKARWKFGAAINGYLEVGNMVHDLLPLFREYTTMLSRNDRLGDLVELVSTTDKVRKLLDHQKETDKQHPELVSAFSEAFNKIDDPVQWISSLEERYRERDKGGPVLVMSRIMLNSLLRDESRTEDAFAVYEKLVQSGVDLRAEPVSKLCAALARKNALENADQLFLRLTVEKPLLPHKALSRGLEIYGRQGMEEKAELVWASIVARYGPTKQDKLSMCKIYAYQGDVEKTLESLRKLFGDSAEKDVDALEVLLSAYINTNDADGVESCFRMMSSIRQPDLKAFNLVLGYHASRADVDAAVSFFEILLDSGIAPDVVSYTSLITAFANRKDLVNVDNIFRAMTEAGIELDAQAWSAVLNAQIEVGDWLNAAKRWSELSLDTKRDPVVASTIMKAFVLLGTPFKQVQSLFRSIRKPDHRAWAMVIQAACDESDMVMARDLFEEMDQRAIESPFSPKPNTFVLSILLAGYLRTGDSASSRGVYAELLKRDLIPSSVTYGIVINSFSKTGGMSSLEQAHEFAMTIYRQSGLSLRPEVTRGRGKVEENLIGPLIVGASLNRQIDNAQAYFELAKGNNELTVPMYTRLMDAYRRVNDVDSVLAMWDKVWKLGMDTTSRISTKIGDTALSATRSRNNILCIPLSIALDSLSSVGRFFDIDRIWNQVRDEGFGFDSHNYNHYAVALARTGDIEGAFKIVEYILLPRNTEVNARRIKAMRSQVEGVDPEAQREMAAITDPAIRPPNRRHQHRFHDASQSAFGINSTTNLNFTLLQSWRPSDLTWRPSTLTIAVLDHAYRQLEEKSSHAWMGLASDEGEGEEGAGGRDVTFDDFGGAVYRDNKDGQPKKSSPRAILMKLRGRYAKTVAMILFHRRKRVDREEAQRRRQ
ncbi:hypothetical protein P7C73_g3761, partial [Tremellales sp. Uapishka_1]